MEIECSLPRSDFRLSPCFVRRQRAPTYYKFRSLAFLHHSWPAYITKRLSAPRTENKKQDQGQHYEIRALAACTVSVWFVCTFVRRSMSRDCRRKPTGVHLFITPVKSGRVTLQGLNCLQSEVEGYDVCKLWIWKDVKTMIYSKILLQNLSGGTRVSTKTSQGKWLFAQKIKPGNSILQRRSNNHPTTMLSLRLTDK
jgi:hypothetical protein